MKPKVRVEDQISEIIDWYKKYKKISKIPMKILVGIDIHFEG